MKKGYISCVLVIVYSSWLCSFCLDCYWYGATGVDGRMTGENAQPPFPGAEMDNIFWFIQISDIHLSVHYDPKRISDLEVFVKEVLGSVNPSLLLVTGDITDAKAKNQIFAEQFEAEWKTYQRVLSSSPLLQSKKMTLIDVRGNHDAFDVQSQDNDFFRQYSSSGGKYNPVLLWKHHLPFGRYSFLAIDATPIPGPRRPYNFFGVLDKDELMEIEKAVASTRDDNMTIVLTHYPSSVITTDHPRLRGILKNSVAHLCGHLHTLGELSSYAPNLYARHPDGHLELELADWKFERTFRLLAIDHDILSFTDTHLHDVWPMVLITNPTNAQFTAPGREPLARIKQSTHIRVLVFSPSPMVQVIVSINEGNPFSATPTGDGLYTVPWNPAHYLLGLHTISVYVQDSSGNSRTVKQQFSLDGSHSSFARLPQFVLLTDFRSLIRVSYFCLWFTIMVFVVINCFRKMNFCFNSKFENKVIFVPLLMFILYNGIGPLYVGEVLSGTYGSIWTHGVYVAGHFVPGSLTYLHSIIELLFFIFPLTVYLQFLTARNVRYKLCHMTYHMMMCLSLIYEVWGYSRVVRSYGVVTILVSPGYSWGLPLSLVLIFLAFKRRTRN